MKRLKTIIFAIFLVVLLIFVNALGFAEQKTVLFDEGHGQKFLFNQSGPLDLSELSKIFQNEGLHIETNKGKITNEVLAKANALVISGAFLPVTPSEIEAIIHFVEKGGRLCIMIHIGSPVADLLHRLNVSISNGVVHEQENQIHNKDLDFYVTKLALNEIMRGVKRFRIFGGWALLNTDKNSKIIAQTSAKAWVDLNRNDKLDKGDALQSFGLVIVGNWGAGQFVVFGDDAIFQNQFLTGENALLGKNLSRWLQEEKAKGHSL